MTVTAPMFGCTANGMSFEDALSRVLSLAVLCDMVETVPLAACPGRILAADFDAALDLPGFDQSAMDGYAVRASDLLPGVSLPLGGRTAAGALPGQLLAGCTHRILTGAPLPHGANAVIAQEQVQLEGAYVRFGAVPPAGTNVRRRGEDIRAGQTLIRAGTRLDWRHVAVLAAQGASSVTVRKRLRVVLLSSGRELRAPGERLSPGQIHDSNMPMLAALLNTEGVDVMTMPSVPDNALAMREALRAASEQADLVITTAGISVGDEDHVRDALLDLGGNLTVLKVAMKPGKPLAAGLLNGALFIGLPGNPMAALAGALAFVRPLLAKLSGAPLPERRSIHTGFTLRRKSGRTEFLPVRLRQQGPCVVADRTGPDGAARLSPLLAASGLALIPAASADIELGQEIEVIEFANVAG